MKICKMIFIILSICFLPVLVDRVTNDVFDILYFIAVASCGFTYYLFIWSDALDDKSNLVKTIFNMVFIIFNAYILFKFKTSGFTIMFIIFVVSIVVSFLVKNKDKKVLDIKEADPSKTINGYDSLEVDLKCSKCNASITIKDSYCPECGEKIELSDKQNQTSKVGSDYIKASSFDVIYTYSEEFCIKKVIQNTCTELGLALNTNLIPIKEKPRFIILNILYSILIFLYIVLIFYHVPYVVYLIGLVVLIVIGIFKNKFNMLDYLYKEVTSRPSEQIDNIVGSVKENLVSKRFIVTGILLPIIVIIAGLLVFREPIIFYEHVDGGYAVRFYFAGWNSLHYATIPDSYNGESVVSLRGNAFSNMPFLNEVYLPDCIYEIRGEAFENDYSLTRVHLPSNLKYLGGESFNNCSNLREVTGLTYETPLSEIRGDTFNECSSLESILIPDSVERIGGHAFYNNSSLRFVDISANSKLKEIGSSAFRNCDSLTSITIPADVSVNSKAFKGSPTKVNKYGVEGVEEIEKHFVMILNDTETITNNKYGEINIKYVSYNSKRKEYTVLLSGGINKEVVFKGNNKYEVDENLYFSFRVSTASSILYVDIFSN